MWAETWFREQYLEILGIYKAVVNFYLWVLDNIYIGKTLVIKGRQETYNDSWIVLKSQKKFYIQNKQYQQNISKI